MLTVSGLSAHYGSSQALFDVNLTLEAGRVITLLGRNGMGKTTTINAIMGLVPPSGGEIRFDGQVLNGMAAFRIANLGLGLVPEGRQVFPNLTVKENLIATASNHLKQSEPWTLARVLDMFPELESRLGSMGNLLSGGEQQMLAIARALMTNPKLLILDEATSALDAESEQKIQEALAKLCRGRTVFIVAHRFSTIKIADRILLFDQGRIVAEGDFETMMHEPVFRRLYEKQAG